MNWNQETAEAEKPLTLGEVRQGMAHLFGKDIIDLAEFDQEDQNDPHPTPPENNFPELENRCPALSLQQIKPVENRWETGCSPSDTRLPFEPKRGPRGILNELPEPTQQRILEMLENRSLAALAETL